MKTRRLMHYASIAAMTATIAVITTVVATPAMAAAASYGSFSGSFPKSGAATYDTPKPAWNVGTLSYMPIPDDLDHPPITWLAAKIRPPKCWTTDTPCVRIPIAVPKPKCGGPLVKCAPPTH